LELFATLDPAGAAPGLAVCQALDAIYRGDFGSAVDHLQRGERALGGQS